MAENEAPHTGSPATAATTGSAVEVIKPPTPVTTRIDWIQLALSLREGEIEVLKLVYLPAPTTRTFREIYQRLERLGYSQRTARRKIAFLAGRQLVARVYSVLGFVGPSPGHANRVQKLLCFLERRRQYPAPGRRISDELMELLADDAKQEIPKDDDETLP